jgi:hypothetical protein
VPLFIVRLSLVRQNQNRVVKDVACDLLALVASPLVPDRDAAAFFGIGIGVVAVVQIARIVAADVTADPPDIAIPSPERIFRRKPLLVRAA